MLFQTFKFAHQCLDFICFGSKRIIGPKICLIRGGGIGDLVNINPVASYLRNQGYKVSLLYFGSIEPEVQLQLSGVDSIIVQGDTKWQTMNFVRALRSNTVVILPQNNEKFLRVLRNYLVVKVFSLHSKVVVSGTSVIPPRAFRSRVDRINK